MAFAQLTLHESLRYIEVCLAANCGKLSYMGLKLAGVLDTALDTLSLCISASITHWRCLSLHAPRCYKFFRFGTTDSVYEREIR